jgi:hypothetical protein
MLTAAHGRARAPGSSVRCRASGAAAGRVGWSARGRRIAADARLSTERRNVSRPLDDLIARFDVEDFIPVVTDAGRYRGRLTDGRWGRG